jgi:hypothetical protein
MIKSLSQVSQLLPMINQEGYAQPGEGLTVLETVTYFFALPTLAFVIIGGLAWIASAPKKEKRKEITQGDSENDNFITFIA